MERFKKFLWGFFRVFMLLLILSILLISYALIKVPIKEPKAFGVTYVDWIAEKYGMDKREVYLKVLDDLGVKNLRLPIYWNKVEISDDVYRFEELDWQIREAEKRGVKLILNIGRKVPRWPECHQPKWVLDRKDDSYEKKELLEFIEVAVKRYKGNKSLYAWQVENEPFLSFGENCPLFGGEFLDEEVALVKSLDSIHPVMVTDSGELSLWFRAQKRGDIFGTTMYITVWTQTLGYYKYPFPPSFFRIKRAFSEIYGGTPHSIVAELQAEPWGPDENYRPENYPVSDQWKTFNDATLREHVEYAQRTGFDEFYLWGVEWWYWIKLQGHPEVWEEAKKLF